MWAKAAHVAAATTCIPVGALPAVIAIAGVGEGWVTATGFCRFLLLCECMFADVRGLVVRRGVGVCEFCVCGMWDLGFKFGFSACCGGGLCVDVCAARFKRTMFLWDSGIAGGYVHVVTDGCGCGISAAVGGWLFLLPVCAVTCAGSCPVHVSPCNNS